MIGAKEVAAAFRTNPAYAGITEEEAFGQSEELSERYFTNDATMKEMGLDLDECIEKMSDSIAEGFVGTVTMTRDPVPAAVALFFWGLQLGFQLGRGYIED